MNCCVESSHRPSEHQANPSCPICHTCNAASCKPGRDRLFGMVRRSFALFRCRFCGCIFQHPFPPNDDLAHFYPKDYWWSEMSKRETGLESFFQRLEKAYRQFVVGGHVRFLEECARRGSADGRQLLDIGCGSGTFLGAARSHGFVPHGMDWSSEAVEIARKQYGFPVHRCEIGSEIWGNMRFDFVTMFHVLEHLTDPRLGLRYAAKLLRPTGTIIIQVPNISSIQARLFGSLWYGLDVPRHVVNYTPKAISLLLREMGLEFRLMRRFSLRDNPASIASSLIPRLDPIRRKVRHSDASTLVNRALNVAYFGLFLLSLPAAFIENACGMGGTIWICAWPGRTRMGSA